MAEHHQVQEVVTDAVPTLRCGGEETVDVLLTQVVPASNTDVRRTVIVTIHVRRLGIASSPFGGCSNTMAVDAMRELFAVDVARDALGNAEPMPAIFPKGMAPIVGADADGTRWLQTAHWGFVMPQTSKKTGEPIQPKAVNNARDDKLRTSSFWKTSFEDRRCLIPATSFCEAKGRNPATYVWFGVTGDDERPPFALAGIWRAYEGNYGGGELREMITSSMVTTTPNALTKQTHPDRMPAILAPDDYAQWLTGTPDEAFDLITPYPAENMVIHQQGEGLKSDRGGLERTGG